jgi:dTDP-4-dehydrorhamnose reductase
MKNILILGTGGMLGYAVTEYYKRNNYNVTAIDIGEYNIATEPIEKLENFLPGIEVLINCAGVIKPMIASMSVEDVLRINSIFPWNLAKLCNKHNIKLFHITTDCVYTGNKGNYNETDYFDADDIYGMTKNAGDTTDCMTLRTSIVGEEKGQKRSLLEWARSMAGKEVNGFLNHLWSGVTTLYFAEIVEKIINQNLYQKGVFHVHSPNTVNKYELLQIFDRVYDLNMKINPVDAKQPCDRSLSSIFELSKKVATKDLETQVREMKEFFEK